MPTIEESAAALETLRSEIAELDALTEPTDEQTTRFAAALAEWDAAKAAHDALTERAAKVEAVRAASLLPINAQPETGFGGGVQVQVKRDPFADMAALRFVDPNSSDLKSRAITALEDTSRGIRDEYVAEAIRKVEQVDGAALWALVHAAPAYRSAFAEWGRTQGNPVYTPEQADAVRAALAIGTGSTGLFAIPTLLDPSLILTGVNVKNPIRRLARVVTGTAPTWNGVSVGAATAYWTAEATAMTDGSPTLAGPGVTAHKETVYLPGSFEVWEDSNLQSDLVPVIAEAFDNLESTAFVSGSGSGAPKGIITAISATAGSTVTATTRGSFTTAASADVFAVVNAVSPRFEESSTWVANKATFNVIRQMASGTTGGSLFWTDLGQATPAQLLGYPIASSSSVTSTTTSGNTLAVLGDFSRFLVYDRLGTFLEFQSIVVDGSGLPTGQRAIVGHKRVGSDCLDVNAFRHLKA